MILINQGGHKNEERGGYLKYLFERFTFFGLNTTPLMLYNQSSDTQAIILKHFTKEDGKLDILFVLGKDLVFPPETKCFSVLHFCSLNQLSPKKNPYYLQTVICTSDSEYPVQFLDFPCSCILFSSRINPDLFPQICIFIEIFIRKTPRIV